MLTVRHVTVMWPRFPTDQIHKCSVILLPMDTDGNKQIFYDAANSWSLTCMCSHAAVKSCRSVDCGTFRTFIFLFFHRSLGSEPQSLFGSAWGVYMQVCCNWTPSSCSATSGLWARFCGTVSPWEPHADAPLSLWTCWAQGFQLLLYSQFATLTDINNTECS